MNKVESEKLKGAASVALLVFSRPCHNRFYMKYFLSLLLVVGLIPFVARADVLQEGYRSLAMKDCVVFENVQAFSSYQFYVTGSGKGFPATNMIDAAPYCSIGERTLIAVSKSNLSAIQPISSDGENSEQAWPNTSENKVLVIPSNLTFSFV
ncbi:MAG: hypothetical protein Q7R83_01045, partial [bacterium]|nr:hypothetical protein [bacterium]